MSEENAGMAWALQTKEAAWRERMSEVVRIVKKWQTPAHIRLHAGEMTAQEMRSVKAVVGAIMREIKTIQ